MRINGSVPAEENSWEERGNAAVGFVACAGGSGCAFNTLLVNERPRQPRGVRAGWAHGSLALRVPSRPFFLHNAKSYRASSPTAISSSLSPQPPSILHPHPACRADRDPQSTLQSSCALEPALPNRSPA
jgi:hypothetical protein